MNNALPIHTALVKAVYPCNTMTSFVKPVTLSLRGVRLVPLALDHEDGLRAAAAGRRAVEYARHLGA